MTGTDLPEVITAVPGPASRARVDVLAAHECPAITARRARRAVAMGNADDDPIVWKAALGSNVEDVDGNRFVDLTSGFGVALVGHRNAAVVEAATTQAGTLIHAMGDAWPDATRIELLQRLAAIAPDPLEVAILGLSGSDAVDAAVKTAVLATGKTGVLTFHRGYHGLALGVLALQGYNPDFTEPFKNIAHPDARKLPYGCDPARISAILDGVGLVMVEPIQGRGGVHEAPDGWLAEVVARAHAQGALVAFDEIQTGIGRTGEWFAGTADVVPDLLCVGKALGGGFPISACLGSRAVMDAWGASTGEALHTQTFLGHPVGCAAALAVLDLLDGGGLEQVRDRGAALQAALEGAGLEVRGRGLMRGVSVFPHDGLTVCRRLMQRGFLCLPAGPTDVGLTPPLTLSNAQIEAFVAALTDVCRELA